LSIATDVWVSSEKNSLERREKTLGSSGIWRSFVEMGTRCQEHDLRKNPEGGREALPDALDVAGEVVKEKTGKRAKEDWLTKGAVRIFTYKRKKQKGLPLTL